MPIRSSRAATLAASIACAAGAWAHDADTPAQPPTPGLRVALDVAAAGLSAPRQLPSQGLPGYLMQGDPGVDRRGWQIEHGTASLGWRPHRRWGAELAAGVHGTERPHLETAWLSTRGEAGVADWTLGAGRRSPAVGALIGGAGHLDRYTLVPLARQALTDGDWTEDGLQGRLARPLGEADVALDIGLWRGRAFPCSRPGHAAPSAHLGLQWDTEHSGDLSLDMFVAQLTPRGRGSRAGSPSGGHSHGAPRCDASLDQVVCFDGRSRLGGVSTAWSAPNWPVTLSAAMLWRQERGSLQSRNGEGDYTARHRGEWAELSVRPAAGWDAGLRHERLRSRQTLVGPGAALLAGEAGLTDYRPLARTAATIGWQFHPRAAWRLEAGRESADGSAAVRYLAARLIVHWESSLLRPASSETDHDPAHDRSTPR